MTDAEKTAMAEVAALMRHGVDMRAAERRERIATACLAGLLAADAAEQSATHQRPNAWDPEETAAHAVTLADALIAALDAKPVKP